jgi:hypothetical protein
MDTAGVQLDEEQHVQSPQPDGVDGEEVAGQDPRGLLTQERLPRRAHPSRRGIKPVAAQGGADGGSRDLDTQPEQLALDTLVTPARILLSEADDQRLQVLV